LASFALIGILARVVCVLNYAWDGVCTASLTAHRNGNGSDTYASGLNAAARSAYDHRSVV